MLPFRMISTKTRSALIATKRRSRRRNASNPGYSLTRCASPVTTRRASSRRCRRTATRVTNKACQAEHQAEPKVVNSSLMQCCNQRRLTTHSSNTTIAITRGFRAYFAIGVRTIHRNQRYRAKRPMHLAPAVTRNSSQIRQVKSALSVTRTFKAERSKRFHLCAVSTSGSIMRSTLRPLV